ncbi:hypothetical protein AKJ39_01845 [candidate division MSBL1 archaeon SCGC-AAA259J03]|uniref:RNase NYN domain-containing protein n=1 Tax=candidate division MSBL1 archaeon SCGC-AAA259J03 TaxID=1698269 RepID=A0A656YWH5_9EURY|nr:hypothetical protein AKJ39_01845 [candidate division MSBL1 archaeon SCGC-AAA259J03]
MVIDGANVIRAGRDPSIERLKSAIKQVRDRGHPPLTYADASSKYVLDHVTALPPKFIGDLKHGEVPDGLKDILHDHGFTRPPAANFRKTGGGAGR